MLRAVVSGRVRRAALKDKAGLSLDQQVSNLFVAADADSDQKLSLPEVLELVHNPHFQELVLNEQNLSTSEEISLAELQSKSTGGCEEICKTVKIHKSNPNLVVMLERKCEELPSDASPASGGKGGKGPPPPPFPGFPPGKGKGGPGKGGPGQENAMTIADMLKNAPKLRKVVAVEEEAEKSFTPPIGGVNVLGLSPELLSGVKLRSAARSPEAVDTGSNSAKGGTAGRGNAGDLAQLAMQRRREMLANRQGRVDPRQKAIEQCSAMEEEGYDLKQIKYCFGYLNSGGELKLKNGKKLSQEEKNLDEALKNDDDFYRLFEGVLSRRDFEAKSAQRKTWLRVMAWRQLEKLND